jgi:hypothetical protein
MRISFRALLPAILVAIAAVLLFLRIIAHRGFYVKVPEPVPDRSVSSPLNVPGGGPAPADAYEIYSALYQETMDEPLVFSEDSVTDIPQANGSCLRPSSPQEHELTDAFEAANRQTHRWEPKFTIPHGYRLLPRDQAAQAQACIESHGQDAARCDAFKQIRHVRFLGVPGFDRAHSHVLVSVVKMCGRYCGSGGIFEVEKTGGTWKRAEPSDFTRECSWMY